MLQRLILFVDARPLWQVALMGLLLAVIIEGVTCLFRFGLDLQSTRDTGWIGAYTFGYRIHHGYIGVVALLVSLFVPAGVWRNGLVILGIGLVVSDLVHHFAVLWPITGSHQFDIRYDIGSDGGEPS